MSNRAQDPLNTDSDPTELLEELSPLQKRLLVLRLDRALRKPSGPPPATHAPTIQPAARYADLPLAVSQGSLWFSEQLAPGLPNYNMPATMLLRGELDEPGDFNRLETAINAVIERHEPLRTIFHLNEDKPVQRPLDEFRIRLAISDLRAYPPDAREQAVLHLYRESCVEPMDLTKGPLIRAGLMLMTREESILLLNLHHIICDGPSFAILLDEIRANFEGAQAEPPTVRYGDFAVWQRDQARGPELQRAADKLEELLFELPAGFFPRDNVPTIHATGGTDCVHFFLSAELAGKLRGLAAKEQSTVFAVYLAAFHLLQYRYSGRTDQAVTSVRDLRDQPELRGLIGNFMDPFIMRANLEGRPNFREIIRRVHAFAAATGELGRVPFISALQELGRREVRIGLPSVFFQILPATLRESTLGKSRMEPLFYGAGLIRFDLEFHLFEESKGIRGMVLFNRDLYEARTIRGIIGHYANLLEGLAAGPDAPAFKIPMQKQEEIRALLVNDAPHETGRAKLLHELFIERSRERPSAVALTYNGHSMTYGEIETRSARLAAHLRAMGLQTESPTGILLERSGEMIISILAVLRAGGAYVPLDPGYPAARLRFMLEDAKVSHVITLNPSHPGLRDFRGDVSDLNNPDCFSLEEAGPVPLAPDNLAYIMYTSGSSGRPRGVGVTHRNVVRLVHGADYTELNESEVLAQSSSISFDASTFEIWGALINGGRLVVLPPGIPTHEDIERAVEVEGVTTLWLTAGLFHQMVETAPETLRKVPRLLAGGDVLSAVHIRELLNGNRGHGIINGYGPTENTTFTTTHAMNTAGDVDIPVPIGRPIRGTRVYVLDPDLNPVPVGVPGEIYTGGAGLSRGYQGDPALTAEKFLPDPFADEPGSRMYRTGDLGRLRPDGTLQFLGRMDDQIKINSFRIEPAEIETALRAHPRVADARVLAVYAAPPASGDERDETSEILNPARMPRRELSAFIVPVAAVSRENPPASADALKDDARDFLRESLPTFMIPTRYYFLEEIPLTKNGKVDDRALLAREIRPYSPRREFVEPRTPMEHRLAEIWREVLGLEQVGIYDDFFDLGGDSLAAIRLRSEIFKQLEREIPLAVFFQDANIAALAAYIKKPLVRVAHSSLISLRQGGARAPFFCVHPLGGTALCYIYLARQLGDDQPFYAFQARGMEKGESLIMSVEEQAEHYLEAMRSVQGEGPYYLGGWSYGGLVAYEMARKLRELGEHTAMLVIMDTIPPTESSPGGFELKHLVLQLGSLLAAIHGRKIQSYDDVWQLGRMLGINLPPPCDLVKLEFEEILDYARDIARDVPRIVAVAFMNFLSSLRYSPPSYDGAGLYLRAGESPIPGQGEDIFTLGWRRLLRGGLEAQSVPGGHLSMLDRHHAPALGERLKMWFARARWNELRNQ